MRYIKHIFLAVILPGAILSPMAYGQEADNCDLKKDEEGIYVYLCDNDSSNFKTIIVELDVPATLSQYAAAVLDVNSYLQWQYNMLQIKVLEKVSPTEFYYYSEVETPWPITNRDFIFHLKMWQEPDTRILKVEMHGVPDFIPKKKNKVRIPSSHSMLTVTPTGPDSVHVRYVLDIDPGGEVPAWIANMFAAQAPWQTYYNLRNRLIKQGKKRIKVDFIKDYVD